MSLRGWHFFISIIGDGVQADVFAGAIATATTARRHENVVKGTVYSAGIIPVRLSRGGPRFLLLRSYRYWDFPKGEIGAGEAPIDAAFRELTEETGLDSPVFRWGKAFVETPRYGRGKIARYYLAEVPTGEAFLPVSAELGRPEHDEYRWASAEQAKRLFNTRLQAVLDWALETMRVQ